MSVRVAASASRPALADHTAADAGVDGRRPASLIRSSLYTCCRSGQFPKGYRYSRRCYVLRYIAMRSSDPSLLIMASLAEGPKHGYAMTRDIEAMAGVKLGPGTLYGAIARLEERGLIEPLETEDRRRPIG